jgi:hypothetical protein
MFLIQNKYTYRDRHRARRRSRTQNWNVINGAIQNQQAQAQIAFRCHLITTLEYEYPSYNNNEKPQ